MGYVYIVQWIHGDVFAYTDEDGVLRVADVEGHRVCQHSFQDEFDTLNGVTVVDTERFIVAASSYTNHTYQLVMMNLQEGRLDTVWHVEGDGVCSRTSPLFHGKYILVASNSSVCSLHQLIWVEHDRHVECRHATIGTSV
jgi:hypothetical protein